LAGEHQLSIALAEIAADNELFMSAKNLQEKLHSSFVDGLTGFVKPALVYICYSIVHT
jgi:hypothetical protein